MNRKTNKQKRDWVQPELLLYSQKAVYAFIGNPRLLIKMSGQLAVITDH